MKNLFTISVFIVTCLTGCQTTSPYKMTNTFNVEEVAWAKEPGSASISGEAFMRTQGGDIRTCAGIEASLTPVSSYADERMLLLYGSNWEGYNDSRQLPAGPTEYNSSTIRTICNADGEFYFNDLAAGEYYLVTPVTWMVKQLQGGNMMRRVKLDDGESLSLIITP
ncbi:hypothetical protein [Photobacterium sp. OFAV2-7]|uniref:hypothetical protein n=1 Tax=Photobacterium sp. OFAV2-7 TaxID=2917748 RepID=UPI001EF568C7|nr:hypothetical protein [Photobacterium sp. OFAV2-7]MCG7584959.1 hypothetical protein [Photobacterium sp. OFAV2-7]